MRSQLERQLRSSISLSRLALSSLQNALPSRLQGGPQGVAHRRGLLLPASTLLPPLPAMVGRRSFESFSLPSQLQVGGVLVGIRMSGSPMASRSGLWRCFVMVTKFRSTTSHCVLGTSGVPVVCSGIGAGSCSRGGLQGATEGSSGTCRPAQSRLLQLSLPGSEGDRLVEAHLQPVYSERVCHPDQVSDEDSSIGYGVDLEGRLDVLHRPQRCLLSNNTLTWILNFALTFTPSNIPDIQTDRNKQKSTNTPSSIQLVVAANYPFTSPPNREYPTSTT